MQQRQFATEFSPCNYYLKGSSLYSYIHSVKIEIHIALVYVPCTVPVPYHVPNAGIRLFSDCPVLKKHIFGIGPDSRAGRRGVVKGLLIFRE